MCFLVDRRRNLLKKDLRRNLFYLFGSWSGRFGAPFDGGKYASALSRGGGATSAAAAGGATGPGGACEDAGVVAGMSTSGSAAVAAANPTTEFEFSALRVSQSTFYIPICSSGWRTILAKLPQACILQRRRGS